MATTEINPFAYNTDPTIEEDTPSLEQYISSIEPPRAEISETPSGDELPPEAHALLKTISKRESPDYHTIYGGQKVADLSKHPGIHVPIKSGPNAGNVSSAAGAYQMIKGTWDAQAAKLGLTDFSPRSQDLAAWNLAQETYAGVHNRDLLSDLKSKDPNVHRQIAKTLAKQWTSLPSGIEQGQNADQYIQEYNINLGGEPISTVETYDIPLANGSILQAPKTATRKEALEYARANGIDAIGLQDIPLANGSILHAPENVSVEEALATAAKANPDYDFTPLKIETPSRTTKQAAQDVGITAAKGAVGAVQGLVGLADLITPGNLGQAVQEHVVDLDKIQKHLTTQFSPQQQEALNNISNAHGFTNILQAVKDNPTGVLEMIGEAVPQMVGGGLGAKAVVYGLEKLATKVPNLASHIAKWGAYEAAGAGEGAMQAGVTKENLRVINPEGEQTGANTAAALGTGAGTALFGALGAKATTALGGVDPTVLLSGQARKVAQQEFGDAANTPGFFKSALVSMIGEGGFQEAPQSAIEQMFQNYATNKPILDGVEDATTKGLVTGALMGGGAHIASNLVEGQEPSAPEEATKVPPTAPETLPPAPEGAAPGGTTEVPPTTPEGTAPEVPPTTPEGATPEIPPTTEEIPEPTVRKTDERQVPEDKHWVDTLGLTPTSGIYKQLKQLDVNDTEHHPYIKDLLDTAARKNMKQDPAAVEDLYTRMDAMSGDEAVNKRSEFAQQMGYTATGAPDRLGRVDIRLQSPRREEIKTAIENQDFKGTLDALSQSKSPIIQWIAEKTKNLSGVSIKADAKAIRDVEVQHNKKAGSYGGFYRPGTEEVVLSPYHADSEWIVAHELLHANVSHSLKNPTIAQRPAVMGIMKLHDTVKSHPTLAKEYGASNIDEFVSEGLSNPEFQYKLKKIKYENTTMWGKFTQAIANLLGAKRDNAFMELLTHTEALMPSKPEHRTQSAAEAAIFQEQAQPNINEARETIISPNEQVQPNANKISETTTPNVSSSAQPEIRQESQSAPISSEGVREGRPESGQIEKENPQIDSTGKLIHPTAAGIKNFWDSFKGSKVTDTEGRPVPMYHGTSVSGKDGDAFKHFETYDAKYNLMGMGSYFTDNPNVAGEFAKTGQGNAPSVYKAYLNIKNPIDMDAVTGGKKVAEWKRAFPDVAFEKSGIAAGKSLSDLTNEQMYRIAEDHYMEQQIPEHEGAENLQDGLTAMGHDGITHIGKSRSEAGDTPHRVYIVFHPDQAKSAIGNTGEFSRDAAEMHFMEVPPDLQEQAKILTDAKLVKTSDKTVLDTAKEAFKNIVNKSPSGIYTRLQTSIVDSGAGLRKALSSLDTFDLNGKLRADMLHSKNQQIFNVINTSFKTGILKFSTAGGLIATDNKNLALRDIFKRIDSLGYADNRSTFFTLMRTLAGEQILRADAINRGKARGMLNAAKDLELFSNMIQDKVQYKKALEDAADLRKEANKILNKIGADVSEGIGREKLVQDAHIQAAKALIAQDARLGPIMADIYSVLDNCVDLWEQSGLVNKDTAKMWRENPAYLPLYKSMDDLLDDPMEYVNFLKSSAKSENKVHTLKGGTHAVNAGENLVKHITFMSGAAAQNQLRKSAVGQLWQIGAAYSTHPNDKQAVMYKHDGKKYFAHIDDPMTLEALETAMPSLSAWAKNAKEVTKVFRTVTLANPLYWYRQLVRDPIHANLVSQTGIVTPYHALKAFVKILANKSETYNILEKHGVVGAVDSLSDPSQFIKAVASTPGTVRRAGDKWMKYHEAADAATRVAVYEAAVKEAKKRGITNKDSIENFAAMRAREIINFSKVGNAQAIASIRATVPFFSAQLNSMDTLARAATGMGLNKKEAARARRLFIQRATVLATVSALWALRMQDDDEYAKSPDWINSWLVPTGDKHNPFFKIPIPFEAGFAFKVLPELMVRLLSGTITPKEAKKDVLRAAGQLLLPPLPLSQIIKPIAEVATNHDFYTGRPIESVSDSRLTRAQRDSKASDLSKFLAKGLPISPDNIEHLGRGYLTELWAVTAALAEPMLHTGPATPEKYLSEMPFLKGIFTRPDQDSAVSRLYDVYQTASEMHNTVTHARKVGEKKTAEELMTDPKNVIEFKASHDLTHIVNRIGKLRTNIERIKNTPDNQLTPTEKKNRIQIIQRQINAAAEQGLATAKKRGLDI